MTEQATQSDVENPDVENPDVETPAAETGDVDNAEVDDTGGAVDEGEGLEEATPPSAGQDDDDDGGDEDGDEDGDDDPLVEEGEIAGDYLEQLLDVLDFDGDIDLDVDGDRAVVSIDGGDDLDQLVGRKGEVLDALQELTRLAVQQVTGDRSRLMLDIARWRADRRERLAALGTKVAERVRDSGEREELDPMTPFERKIVHDAVAAVDGVYSESEGSEPRRRVVVIKG
ncbi:protein jag [Gordonia caeni]|uniref:R3H domain-containing protein n=1 Tax=Gordonia caeni TaxID=1007097 RepID=A0ABP7NKD4_9ACTN